MQYLLIVLKPAVNVPAQSEWSHFFDLAEQSGMFRGGSRLEHQQDFGLSVDGSMTSSLTGYMRFDTTDKSLLEQLLVQHPVVKHGGSISLFAMPHDDKAIP